MVGVVVSAGRKEGGSKIGSSARREEVLVVFAV